MIADGVNDVAGNALHRDAGTPKHQVEPGRTLEH